MSKYMILQSADFEKAHIARPHGKEAVVNFAREAGFDIIDIVKSGKSIAPIIPREQWDLYVSRKRPTKGTIHDSDNMVSVLRRLERIEECMELLLGVITEPKK